MSYLEAEIRRVPSGLRKVLYFHWPLALLLAAVSCAGFLMLYSVAGGNIDTWAMPQIIRFGAGMVVMAVFAFVPLKFWRSVSFLAYLIGLALLIGVDVMGEIGMGARRWIDLGVVRLQPSELMKIGLVMVLAAYYDWLPEQRLSRPVWVIIPLFLIALPTMLVLRQPDLGTAILLVMGGGVMMFVAGVSWWYFATSVFLGVGAVAGVMYSKGTEFQLLKDYQYRRISTFLDPSTDPLGAGYHITQSKIALGSGGISGRGFMQGTQSRLNFLPEKHTDFIFTTLAEEFGFVGSVTLLTLYLLIVVFCVSSALNNRNRYGALLTMGIAAAFFFYFAVNMAMVMGLAPVVGVPLPLVSYGGSAMMVLLAGFGLVQSAHVHKPR